LKVNGIGSWCSLVSYFECVFDDVSGSHFAVDCLHGVFDCVGCGSVALLLKNGLQSSAQAGGA
jgi:hypothetical protein